MQVHLPCLLLAEQYHVFHFSCVGVGGVILGDISFNNTRKVSFDLKFIRRDQQQRRNGVGNSFNFDFYVSKIMRLWIESLPRRPGGWVSGEPGQSWGRGLVAAGWLGPRWFLLLAVLVVLGVARCCLWLFTLCMDIKISKNSC